ncbi:STT3 domain-containing protein [Halostella litorea]|uniref:STT3 domain-containing protein n=1 Tax=Halostella litorea TaxID=2528831 RepID=UPI0010921519|nr:STT3 domain-containing protein [Halostella litorea]
MTDAREEVVALLADRPELEPALREIRDVDGARETWTFDDVSVDSGAFGEIVASGVVESAGDEYRLADPVAVDRALDGATADGPGGESSGGSAGVDASAALDRFRERLPRVRRDAAAALAAALALVALFRLVASPSVFRNGDIVLLANDPYFYRHWLLQLAADDAGLFAVPDRLLDGEPLLAAVLWSVARTVGGDARTVDLTLAWYPVAAALVTGLAVYGTARRLTDDARVGVAAVGLLAVTPVHAYRSAVGFGDHHAFDYMLVAVALYALVALAAVDRDRPPRDLAAAAAPWTGLLALGVAAQVLAWNAGPLLILPVGLYVLLRAAVDLRAGRSPLRGLGPELVAVALAAGAVWGAHGAWGWHAKYVALTPAFLLFGSLAVAVVAEAGHRADLSWLATGGGLVAAAAAVFGVVWRSFPDFRAEFRQEVERLALKPGQGDIVETGSLFDPDLGGPLAPIFYFGLALFLALPYAAWGGWAAVARDRTEWLAATAYVVVLLVLGVLQVRFAGALAVPVAVVGGLGFVHLASVVDLARRPTPFGGGDEAGGDGSGPSLGAGGTRSLRGDGAGRTFDTAALDGRTAGLLVALTVLVAGLGAGLTPPLTDDLTIEEESYRAAAWLGDDADAQGLAADERYVFSRWDRNRLYNAFASGQSDSYGYARANYQGFLVSTDPGAWYDRLSGRAAYVVTGDRSGSDGLTAGTVYATLQERKGNGTAHYRAVYATDGGERTVFRLVPGATVTGEAASNGTVTLSREVDIGGETFTYARSAAVGNGTFSVTVAYPGEYAVGNRTVTVPESAVANGTSVAVNGTVET